LRFDPDQPFPLGLDSAYRIFYIIPMIGATMLGFGFSVTSIPLSAFSVDPFKVHAASAITATIMMRCIVGTVLPLARPQLYANLKLGWGSSLFEFVELFVPVPMLLRISGSVSGNAPLLEPPI